MPLFVKGTNTEIIGTLDDITGIALAYDIDQDGEPVYSGETKVDWDSQRTRRIGDGQRVWVDESGREWPQNMIEKRADDIEDPDHVADVIERARTRYCLSSDANIEIDDETKISVGDDGTWVRAWVLVPNEN